MSNVLSNSIDAAREYPALFALPFVVLFGVSLMSIWLIETYSISSETAFSLGLAVGSLAGFALGGIGSWYLIGQEATKLRQEGFLDE